MCLLSLAAADPISLFHQSFIPAPITTNRIQRPIAGATPANTYPLVIRPLNFAPGIKAPSPIFISQGSLIPGAIPLFAPLQPFPYVKYIPISTAFNLVEPNVRYPFGNQESDDIPSKIAAPLPAFSPVHDTRKPVIPPKPETEQTETKDVKKSQMSHPKKRFKPTVTSPQQHEQLIRVAHFPTFIGSPKFSFRDDSSLKFQAPAGIVKSSQPSFTYVPFRNSKFSHNLIDDRDPQSQVRYEEDSDEHQFPTVIDF